MAHAAFERNPTDGTGVLRCDTFQPLTLQGVVVDIDVLDTLARLQITFEYKNATNAAQSAFAAFARVAGWSVSAISCSSENRWVRTLVSLNTSGVLPATPESETFVPTVVTQAIPWELMVHESVVCTATYYAPLELLGGKDTLQLRIPKSLFPRRIDVDQTARDYNAKFEIKGTTKLAKSIFMNIRGEAFEALAQPPTVVAGTNTVGQSTNHQFAAKWESHAHELIVDEDLLFQAVLVPSPDPLKLKVWKDVSAGKEGASVPAGYTFAGTIALSPAFTAEQQSTVNDEIVFVLDHSASMLPHWADVVRAVKIAVASLPSTTYVNLVWYSEGVEYLFPQGSELLSQSVRDLILDEVLSFTLRTPSSCGTKLYQAIQSLYKQPYITGFVRNMILVTDSGAEEHLASRCIDVARSNVHSTRFSVIAVGSNADKVFLSYLAKEANGVFEDSSDSKKATESLMSILNAVHVPTLVHVVARAEYDGAPDDTPPIIVCAPREHLPCVPKGSRLLLPFFGASELKQFTCVVGGMLGLHHVDYKTLSPDLRSLQNQTLSEAKRPETSSILHVAAALRRIQRLCSDNDHSAMTPAEREEVAVLSASFMVPSPVTVYVSSSYLQPTGEAPSYSAAISTARYISSRNERKAALVSDKPVLRDATGLRTLNADDVQEPNVVKAQVDEAAKSTKAYLQSAVIEELLRLVSGSVSLDDVLLSQDADGSFRPSCRLFAGIGLTQEAVESRMPQDTDARLWCTALAGAFLEEQPAAATIGALAIEKGRGFLRASGAESLLTTAKRVLSSK